MTVTNVTGDSTSDGRNRLKEHMGDKGNPHEVMHDQLTDITPDQHHPQEHTLASHVDVTVTDPEHGHFLTFEPGGWENRIAGFEAWPSGVVDGGELNIGPGPGDIEVIAGRGIIVDTYTHPDHAHEPSFIEWAQINTPITAAPALAGRFVFFSIDNLGALVQRPIAPTEPQMRAEIFLGLVVHNGDTWGEISSPIVINNAAHTLVDLVKRVIGPTFIIDGGGVTETASFTLAQEAGTVWEMNRNWHVDKTNPHREDFLARAPMQFRYVNRDFSTTSALTSTVDPSNWDNAGTVEAVPPPPKNTTIQRLYIDPRDNIWMLHGQNLYSTFDEAQALIDADTAKTVVPPLLSSSILLGYVVSQSGETDWTMGEAHFVAAAAGSSSGAAGAPITDHALLTNIQPDDHHAQSHSHNGADDSGTVSYGDLTDLPAAVATFWDVGTNPDDIVNTNVGKVGIGTATPGAALTVEGQLFAGSEGDAGIVTTAFFGIAVDQAVTGALTGVLAPYQLQATNITLAAGGDVRGLLGGSIDPNNSKLVTLTQAAYDALTPVNNVLYFIVG